MTHASLFSGIGAAELAARMMGWSNLFHCEIDGFCRRILQYHFPEQISYDDIRKTDFTPWRGLVDVLSGGFPCQPFSCAGRRKGAADDRYLWPEFARAISEIRPAWVVGENVAGILSMVQPGKTTRMEVSRNLFGEEMRLLESRSRFVSETICLDLEGMGYSVRAFVIPACAVGAPHRRDRVFFVAHRDGDRRGNREGEQEPHSRGGPRPTIAALVRDLLPTVQTQGLKRCGRNGRTEFHPMGLLPTPNAADADHYSMTRIPGSQAGSQIHALAVNGLLATPRSNNAPDLDLSNPNLAARRRGNLEEQLARSIQTDSRKTDGRTSLQLNPLFVEEMMGFPSMWTASPFLIPNGDGSQ